jgi:hypothetical protein
MILVEIDNLIYTTEIWNPLKAFKGHMDVPINPARRQFLKVGASAAALPVLKKLEPAVKNVENLTNPVGNAVGHIANLDIAANRLNKANQLSSLVSKAKLISPETHARINSITIGTAKNLQGLGKGGDNISRRNFLKTTAISTPLGINYISPMANRTIGLSRGANKIVSGASINPSIFIPNSMIRTNMGPLGVPMRTLGFIEHLKLQLKDIQPISEQRLILEPL